MSKNPGNFEDENTEFNFSDTDDVASPASSPSSAPPPRISPSIISRGDGRRGGLLANKRTLILLSVGLIVGVLAIFKILEWVMTPSSKPRPALTVAVTPTEIAKDQPLKEQALDPAKNQMNLMVEGRLQTQSNHVEKLQQKVGQLEMTIEDLQTQFAMMSQLAQGMSQQLQQQTALKIAPVVAKPVREKKKMLPQPKVVEAPAYYIQALVPGRAWLVNQKGTSTTVGVGDEVPGYGVIAVIDLEQGIVSTDKGQIIRYHSSDR